MYNIFITLEVVKFCINGLIAAAVHFFVLYICINFFLIEYYGVSNSLGAIFGIISSFIGNRYFVFHKSKGNFLKQSLRFSLLYLVIAVNHGLFLYLWSDVLNKDYIIGFFLITCFNTILSFLGNKYKVFK